jgi:hypothetical protein
VSDDYSVRIRTAHGYLALPRRCCDLSGARFVAWGQINEADNPTSLMSTRLALEMYAVAVAAKLTGDGLTRVLPLVLARLLGRGVGPAGAERYRSSGGRRSSGQWSPYAGGVRLKFVSIEESGLVVRGRRSRELTIRYGSSPSSGKHYSARPMPDTHKRRPI